MQQKCSSETGHGGIDAEFWNYTGRCEQVERCDWHRRRDATSRSVQFCLQHWLPGLHLRAANYKTILHKLNLLLSLLTWLLIGWKDSIKLTCCVPVIFIRLLCYYMQPLSAVWPVLADCLMRMELVTNPIGSVLSWAPLFNCAEWRNQIKFNPRLSESILSPVCTGYPSLSRILFCFSPQLWESGQCVYF